MVTSNDLVLLLEVIHFAGNVEGRKRLQKIICILKHQYQVPLGFNYIPYFYGPYSDDLADSIQSLIGAGYVQEESVEFGVGIYQYTYSLTPEGEEVVNNVVTTNLEILNVTPNRIRELVNGINHLETRELVTMSKQLDLESELIA